MTHIMIDLETLGTTYHAPVLAIGAVVFDPDTGEIGKKFYGTIDMAEAVKHGRTDGATVRWWLQQSEAARQQIITGKHSPEFVFDKFYDYLTQFGEDIKVWGNGSTFDITILEFAFPRILEKTAPWKFWNVRDCRTIKELASGVVVFEGTRTGTHHNAIDDACHQAAWVSNAWQALRNITRNKTQPDNTSDLLG